MSELKPCPFCGGAVTWENPHRDRGGQVAGSAPYYFVCRQCGYFFNFGFKSQYKNVEMWNKRALANDKGGRVSEEKLRMDAYYYGFNETGVKEIDLILCAIASAGKSYHHTDDWNSECTRENCEGKTPIEWIQNAAIKAANKMKILDRENTNSSEVEK